MIILYNLQYDSKQLSIIICFFWVLWWTLNIISVNMVIISIETDDFTHKVTSCFPIQFLYRRDLNYYQCHFCLNLPSLFHHLPLLIFLTNLTSKQKVLLITPNHWKLLLWRPPGESSCSALALIHVTYANVHPFERFSRNMMLFRLPIIVYIITPLHNLVEFW